VGWPSDPGPGPYPLSLADPAFYILLGLLAIFIAMFLLLRRTHPNARRALDGYLEAAAIDMGFLVFAVLLVVALAVKDPHGNTTAFALFRVVLGGYWLAFSIPIVTVGSSIHTRSRGGIPWRIPALGVAALLFGACFAYYYASAGAA
jgi:hypothetical protein